MFKLTGKKIFTILRKKVSLSKPMVSFTEEKGSGDEGEEEGGKKKKKKKKGEKEEPKKKTKKAPVSSLIYPLRSSVVECLT